MGGEGMGALVEDELALKARVRVADEFLGEGDDDEQSRPERARPRLRVGLLLDNHYLIQNPLRGGTETTYPAVYPVAHCCHRTMDSPQTSASSQPVDRLTNGVLNSNGLLYAP